MPPKVYLIRHGETEWSLSGQHTGRTDIPLTTKGERQARRLSDRLRGIQFEHVVSSPRQRARRTGELAGFGQQIKIRPDLAEWDYGDYEGLNTAAIRKQRPNWNLFQHGCPGGEVPPQISARADRAMADLRSLTGNILVFSHGHFIRALAVRWVGWPVVEAQRLLLNTASVSILGFDHDNLAEPVIAQWNAAAE